MKYYRLEDSFDIDDRWHLNGLYDGSGVRYESRDFVRGQNVSKSNGVYLSHWNSDVCGVVNERLSVRMRRSGSKLDFTFADSSMPVLSGKAASIFEKVAKDSIELISVEVAGMRECFEIMNVTRLVDCLDVNKSVIQWYEVGNAVRPDLAGTPEMITKLCINPEKVIPLDVLRVKGWEIAIIVSERMKDELQSIGITGVTFSDVTPATKK